MPTAAPALAAPLRIAFVVHYFPQLSEAFIINQAAALIERGHQVDIYAWWGLNPLDPQRFPVAARAGLLDGVKSPQFERALLPRLRRGLWLARHAFAGRTAVLLRALNPLVHRKWALNLRLLHEAAMFDGAPTYDVVHCQFADLAPQLLRLRRIGAFDAPVVVHLRGIDITRRPRELGLAVYRRSFAQAQRMLANCDYFRGRALALGCPQDKLGVFRSAIDLREFAWRGPRADADTATGGRVRLALVGRLVEKKGVPWAVDALAELVRAGQDVELSVLGDGPLRAELEARGRQLGLDGRLHWLGAGGHHEVLALLLRSDVLLAPSVTAKDGDQDAPVNTLKEAMAIGLPVIGTDHGGIPELIEDGISGYLVPERDAAALAQAVTRLIQRRGDWAVMGAAGRAKVAMDYDLQRQTDALVALDRELAAAWRQQSA